MDSSRDVLLETDRDQVSTLYIKKIFSTNPLKKTKNNPSTVCFCLIQVLASRDPLSEEQIHAYDGLVKEISTQDVEGNILPHVFRLAKRSPESVLKNSTVFLAMKNGWDLSGSAEKAILELLPLLRHSKDSVRYIFNIIVRRNCKAQSPQTSSSTLMFFNWVSCLFSPPQTF